MTTLKLDSWFTYNNYYKGDLDNLQIWNKGLASYKQTKIIDLFDYEGNFYKKEYVDKIIDSEIDLRIDELQRFKKTIVQIDYDFHLVSIPERLQLQDGRNQLKILFSNYGIKGFNSYSNNYIEYYNKLYKKNSYEVYKPIEISFCTESRLNTKSFMNFNYKKYIENYKKALKTHPEHEGELNYLKQINLNIICDFYKIDISVLKNKNFNRFKHAIKVLNNKITNKKFNN